VWQYNVIPTRLASDQAEAPFLSKLGAHDHCQVPLVEILVPILPERFMDARMRDLGEAATNCFMLWTPRSPQNSREPGLSSPEGAAIVRQFARLGTQDKAGMVACFWKSSFDATVTPCVLARCQHHRSVSADICSIQVLLQHKQRVWSSSQ
jgi:hypothetical protein